MKFTRAFAALLLSAGLAACDSIGDGNTVERLQLVLSPAPLTEQAAFENGDTENEALRMYTCFCSNLAAIAHFTDGTLANFSFRVTFTSDRPDIVEVRNAGSGATDLCPVIQQIPGVLVPKAEGTAFVTAEFAGLRDTLKVIVGPTPDPATFTIKAVDPLNTDLAVAVGATLPLRVDAVIDGKPRFLNANVTSWEFDPPLDNIATIDVPSLARGVGIDGGDPQTLKAKFAACSAAASADLRVGRIAALSVAEEPDFATDQKLAANSQEGLQISGALDFDGDGTADGQSQLLNQQVSLSFTDSCTLREYDAGATNGCKETARNDCASTLPVCTANQTSCGSTMTACRVGDPAVVVASGSRILALADADTPTNFSATFPQVTGVATTLALDAPAGSTALELAAYAGYPTTFPWEAVVDGEFVLVTAASGTTVTLDVPTAQLHLSGSDFAQRKYASTTPLEVTGDGRTLSAVSIDDPVGPLAAFDTLQVHATGTFADTDGEDPVEATRTQRITQLAAFAEGSPTLLWGSSDSSVANVLSQTGFINSTGACGGRAFIRARATTSENTLTATFDADSDADDLACTGPAGTDPLCDQVEICVDRATTLPPGTTCEDPAPAPC